jgi:hypothetical protein
MCHRLVTACLMRLQPRKKKGADVALASNAENLIIRIKKETHVERLYNTSNSATVTYPDPMV